MATERAMIDRRKHYAGKLETTTGTAIALAAADGAILMQEPKLKYLGKATRRKAPGAMTNITPVAGMLTGQFTGWCYLVGNGLTGAGYIESVLLPACGLADSTGVNTVTSAPISTLTIGLYEDGWVKKIAGAMGKVKFSAKAGDPMKCEWDFMGKRVAPATGALLAITLPTIVPPRFAGATLTLASTSYYIPEIEIDVQNKISIRPDGNDATGAHAALIVDRDIIVTLKPEKSTAKDFCADFLSGATAALAFTIGSTQYNTIAFSLPYLCLDEEPDDIVEEGIIRDGLSFVATSTTIDSELTITNS